jgi:predicted HAD superfamily Cof-like phosphohydrolase
VIEFSNKSYAAQVQEFMLNMGQLNSDELVDADFALSKKLVDEEAAEYAIAWEAFRAEKTNENRAKLVGEIVDLIYVLLWTAIKFDLPIHSAFLAVQKANMAKIQPDGTVLKNAAGKVQKPEGWKPADLLAIINWYEGESNA